MRCKLSVAKDYLVMIQTALYNRLTRDADGWWGATLRPALLI